MPEQKSAQLIPGHGSTETLRQGGKSFWRKFHPQIFIQTRGWVFLLRIGVLIRNDKFLLFDSWMLNMTLKKCNLF